MAKIIIDNKEYEVEEGKNVLETCLSLGLDLPYFCWHPELDSVGACRQCAVIKYKDEDDKKGKLTMACMEPVTDNLRISLDEEEAKQFRANNIEALMINHPHDCPVCDEGGECHLQDMTVMTGHNYRRYRFKKRTHNNQYLGPFIKHEMNRCIQCYRCVRFYKDYAGGKDLDVFGAHNDVYFGRFEPGTLENEFSGNLVEICPTGVFTDKTLDKHYTRKWDLTNAPSVCHNCGLGCNIIASERYGTIRRILTRYNGDVNGYFLCDRGRFGYEYVNSNKRILTPFKKENGVIQLTKKHALQEIKNNISGQKMIGVGSPRASLESNFLLQQWVGAENFYAGIPEKEGKLLQQIIEITQSGKAKMPSLNEVKDYDAVFILGEDVTNTAPMLALNLRQAAKNQPEEPTKDMDIPAWNDAGIREVVQHSTGPFYIAAAHHTKLDDIVTQTMQAHPDEIARLGYAVARKINSNLPDPNSSKEINQLAETISEALLNAKKPLIVAGTSLFSQPVIEAAANIAFALTEKEKEAGLFYVVPEVNSVGLISISKQFLEGAIEKVNSENETMLVVLENDIYRRTDKKSADRLFEKAKSTIMLDSLENETTKHASFILPAGTFAEASGTVINNEGRAQRFYQVHVPANDVQSSWKWIQEIMPEDADVSELHLDGVVEKLAKAFPKLKEIKSVAPPADYRKGTQKIPREPHRYSGRTSMHANVNVSEAKPPEDPDSPLSYTMEGYNGVPPSEITPYYWSPRWNSVQSINKYQIEVGGKLHGGNPGKRLFDSKNSKPEYFESIPKPFKPEKGEMVVLPVYHIFGTDEQSAESPAVTERVPEAYIALNDADAAEARLKENDKVEISAGDKQLQLPVKLNLGLAKGIVGLPKGLHETSGIQFPFRTTIKKVQND